MDVLPGRNSFYRLCDLSRAQSEVLTNDVSETLRDIFIALASVATLLHLIGVNP